MLFANPANARRTRAADHPADREILSRRRLRLRFRHVALELSGGCGVQDGGRAPATHPHARYCLTGIALDGNRSKGPCDDHLTRSRSRH